MAEAESLLANDGDKLAQAKEIIDLALDLAKNCPASYPKATPEVRKMWNRAELGEHVLARYVQREGVRGMVPTSRTRSPSRPCSVHTKVDGGPKGIRTPDLMAASHALYQLSYGPQADRKCTQPDEAASESSQLTRGASRHSRSRS